MRTKSINQYIPITIIFDFLKLFLKKWIPPLTRRLMKMIDKRFWMSD